MDSCTGSSGNKRQLCLTIVLPFCFNCRIWTAPASNQLTWLLTRIQEQRLHWVTLERSSWLDSTTSPCPILTVTSSSVISWQRHIKWQNVFLSWVSAGIVLHYTSLWVLLLLYPCVSVSAAFCWWTQQSFVCSVMNYFPAGVKAAAGQRSLYSFSLACVFLFLCRW